MKKISSSPAVLTVVLAAMLGMMGAIGPSLSPASAELVDRIAVVVNDDIILQSELDQAMVPIKQRLKKQGYSSTQLSSILAEQRAKTLEQMIHEKLTDQQSRRYGIRIDDQEVDATIERVKSVNRLSDEQFRQALAMEGLTYEAYRTQAKGQLLRTRLVNYEVRSKIVITDADLKAYYNDHRDRYEGKSKYHLRHILIKVSSEAGELEKTRAFQQTQAVYKRLQQGEPFAKVASVYSDASTAKNGGDLGVFEVSLLTDKARQSLADIDVGQFSQVVETEQGYQIYFVEDKISTGGSSLEDVRSEIQEKLYAEKVDQKYRLWVKQLRQRAHIQIME